MKLSVIGQDTLAAATTTWGRSEILKGILHRGEMGRRPPPFFRRRGMPRGSRLTPKEREEILWLNATPTDLGCWEWRGAKNKGYGTYRWLGEQTAPRVAWKCARTDITSEICVCHHCDNPGCINPDHLFLGTIADNNHDRHNKGRTKGPDPWNSRTALITPEIVLKIRRLRSESSLSYSQIGSVVGCSKITVRNVVKGYSWSSIK